MPNWCNNWTHFRTNDRAQAERLVKAFEEKRPFQEFVPCPQELYDTTSPNRDEDKAAELREKYGHADWYTWCTTNWSTKWDTEAYNTPTIDDDGEGGFTISVSFDTAWSPPIAVYEQMTAQGWNITGYFIEWGMNFCGIWDDGNDQTYDIPQTAEEAEDELPDDLEEVFDICQALSEREAENEDV